MNIFKGCLIIVCSAGILSGCAKPQVELQHNFWVNHKQTVAVGNAVVPHAALRRVGPQGILDYAVRESVDKRMEAYLASLSHGWVFKLKNTMLATMQRKGIHSQNYSRTIALKPLQASGQDNKQYAVKNYTPLVHMIGKDELLLVQVNGYGLKRRFYGMIPLGAPKGYCSLTGRIVNLHNNHILWRKNVDAVAPILGRWDQPPNYPNATKAIKLAIKLAGKDITQSFRQHIVH